jgi:two-component system sensor kinase FixL
MVGAMQDVSEQKEAQDTLRRLQAGLIQVSRLSAMGAVASTLAHELNQPLTGASNWLAGGLRLLRSDQPAMPAAIEALERSLASVTLAGQIVWRMQKLVRSGQAETTGEDLGELLAEASTLLAVVCTDAGVSATLKAQKLVVEIDRVQIQQVVLNLMRNAVESMSGRDQRELIVSAQKTGEFATISVSDTGPGLSTTSADNLFAPFNSTKENGLGLGLSISRTIVEAHGGKIWAEPNAFGGASFNFTVPLARS